jgi:hypothetical protein
VVHRDRLDVVAPIERVHEADDAVPAEAEGVGHLGADEVVDDDFPAVQPVRHGHAGSRWMEVAEASVKPRFPAGQCGGALPAVRDPPISGPKRPSEIAEM